MLSRIDFALLERLERGDTVFAPGDPQSGADAARFHALLEDLLLHEELGLVAVTQTSQGTAPDGPPVGAVAERTEHGRRRLDRHRAG